MTGDVIKGYNRDTAWLATGVLGAVVLAALMLAVEEHRDRAVKLGNQAFFPLLTKSLTEGVAAERHLLTNANSATVESVLAKGSNSTGKMTSGPGSSIDPTFTEHPLQEIPTSEMESAASTPFPAASTPQKNRDASRQGSAQAPASKTRIVKNRSLVVSRFIDVKRRLIELWHQSLAQRETRSWTAFSKLNGGIK